MSGLELMGDMLAMESGAKIIFVSGDDSVGQEPIDAGAAIFPKKSANIKLITDTVIRFLNR